MLNSGEFRGDSRYKLFVYANDERIVAKLDKENNKITTAYKYKTEEGEWGLTLPDGYTYIDLSDEDEKTYTYTVYAPDGSKKEDTLVYPDGDGVWDWGATVPTGVMNGTDCKYVAYIMWKTADTAWEDGFPAMSADLYGIKRDGTRDTLYSENMLEGFWHVHAGANYVSWVDQRRPMAPWGHVYSADEDKVYNLGNLSIKTAASGTAKLRFEQLTSRLYGKKAVGYFSSYDDKGELKEEAYALIALSDDGDAKVLGKPYKSMSTYDGEIYLVETDDGRRGYIDSDGNEIAFFDYADTFVGDYAPVVKNGKGYLIDRSMNRVSENIAATQTATYDEGLYGFSDSNSAKLVTYSNETVAAPEESEPDSRPESSVVSNAGYVEPSEPASSSSVSAPADDSNPGTGVALSVLPVAAALSAVVVIKKKK